MLTDFNRMRFQLAGGFIRQTGLGLWGEMWDQHTYYHAFQSLQRL